MPTLPLDRLRRSLALLVPSLVLTTIAACSGEPPAPTQPPAQISRVGFRPGEIRAEERHLHALAREIPGFGGYYLDNSGAMVAYVTDPSRDNALRRRLEGALRVRPLGARARTVTVLRGRFDFPSLARWRDAVSTQLLGVVPGVISSDADEGANRVTIGIDEVTYPGVRANVLRGLERIGVPASAVRFIADMPTAPDVASATLLTTLAAPVNQNLDDVPSPIVAGYRILAPGGCTLGFVVEVNGSPGVISNSHCGDMYQLDGAAWQTSDLAVIGYETSDPGFTCGTNCRYSDAALASLSGGIPYEVGRVARTTDVTFSWGVSGSLDVDQSNPTRDMIGVVDDWDIVVGLEVFKTGQTTGTTGGTITQTCTDALGTDGYWRACSFRSTYFSGGGDSGSPVYTYVPGTGGGQVRIVGIHWGGSSVTQTTAASYYSRITSEIPGNIVATRPTPLAVYISGPTDVNSSPSCRLAYEAVVTGGAMPYTYSWTTDGVIHNDFGYAVILAFPPPPAGDARMVEVTVTDALGATAVYGLGVTANSTYDICYT